MLSTSAVPVFLGHVGQTIFEVFGGYRPEQSFYKDIFWDERVSLENEWTSEMASHLLQFWQQIEWSAPTTDEVGRTGVTWTELAIAFMLDRKVAIPTRIPLTNIMTYDINQLRNSGHGFFHVPKSLFWLAQWVNKATDGILFDELQRGRATSLQKMGSTNQGRGFIFRPSFPKQMEVARVLERYHLQHGRFAGLTLWPLMEETEDGNEIFWTNLQTVGN